MVVKDLSKKIAQLGHDVNTSIFETNMPSRRLFEKLGFESLEEIHYIFTPFNWTAADDE